MPEYLSPGVYVEEFEIGAKPIEGVGTSTAGFLGMTERGPLKPRLVDSFAKFTGLYGGHIADSYTAYALEGFFTNGGQRCYVGRVIKGNAGTAQWEEPLSIEAVGPGAWGNRVGVRIEDASAAVGDKDLSEKMFKLIAVYFSKDSHMTAAEGENLEDLLTRAAKIEVYDNLTCVENSPDHFMKRINGNSTLIEIKAHVDQRPENTGEMFTKPSEEGSDGDETLTRQDLLGTHNKQTGEKTGLIGFTEVDEIAILCAPDIHNIDGADGKQGFVSDMLAQCEKLKDRFAILDVPAGIADPDKLSITSKDLPFRTSKYGAIYAPWIKVMDPLTNRKKTVPPGGHMAGIYARSDQERGVHKAPANEVVRGALELEFQFSKGEQDILNPRHINCIRFFKGRGILVWGARTTILDALWKYINVRRLFIFIEESIEEGTQWVVFEPNDQKLWSRVLQTITQFLTKVWRDGALMGTTPEEAFFVKCDRTTMTQDDIDNGRLICVIGIAPVKPAEFVIFRIAQWQGGSAVTE